MFLIRSAFWLTVAFLVIRPGMDVDVRDTAATASRDAMAYGSQFIAQQIDAIECENFTCIGGKAVASAALKTSPTAADPMHRQAAGISVPLPRPRPDRTG